jgi:hypothetical protein
MKREKRDLQKGKEHHEREVGKEFVMIGRKVIKMMIGDWRFSHQNHFLRKRRARQKVRQMGNEVATQTK